MNRFVVSLAVTTLTLIACAHSQTSTNNAPLADSALPNFEMILEGPFEVCEDVAAKQLQIFVPNLEVNHFVPGFSTGWWELPLGIASPNGDGPAHYPKYDANVTGFQLTLPGKLPGAMTLVAPISDVYLYHEPIPQGYDCSKVLTSLASVSLTLPLPDKIIAQEPAPGATRVTDLSGRPKGPCPNPYCKHATRVILYYLQVDPAKVTLSVGNPSTTCPTTDSSVWCPVLSPIGNEASLLLDVQPIPPLVGNVSMQAHAQSVAAFQIASAMAGTPQLRRNLEFEFPMAARTSAKGKAGVFVGPAHGDCHAPIMVICNTCK